MYGAAFQEYTIVVCPVFGAGAKCLGDSLESVIDLLVSRGARLMSVKQGRAFLRYGSHPRP